MDGNRSAMTSKNLDRFSSNLVLLLFFSGERGLVILLIFDIDTLFDCICCFERIVTLWDVAWSSPPNTRDPFFNHRRINQIDFGSNQLETHGVYSIVLIPRRPAQLENNRGSTPAILNPNDGLLCACGILYICSFWADCQMYISLDEKNKRNSYTTTASCATPFISYGYITIAAGAGDPLVRTKSWQDKRILPVTRHIVREREAKKVEGVKESLPRPTNFGCR